MGRRQTSLCEAQQSLDRVGLVVSEARARFGEQDARFAAGLGALTQRLQAADAWAQGRTSAGRARPPGRGASAAPRPVVVDGPAGHGRQTATGARVVLATGTTATRDDSVEFDGRRILTSDDAVSLDRLPRTLVVIGAGVIGLEYASMFAALGVRVTLLDKRPRLLSYMDPALIHISEPTRPY